MTTIRDDRPRAPRARLLLAVLACLGLSAMASAQGLRCPLAGGSFPGDKPWDAFGTAVASAGDVNRDGVPDLIVGAPQGYWHRGAQANGYARVLSGKDGKPLLTLRGTAAGDRFGTSVAAAGDVNRDGFADLLVGAPFADAAGRDSGQARVFSGKDGKVLLTVAGTAPGDGLGTSVCSAGDVNGDRVPDLVVGASQRAVRGQRAGYALVLSGKDGKVLLALKGDTAGDLFGQSVAGLGDVSGDGIPDLVVGAPQDRNGMPGHGYARVLSGRDGKALWTARGDASGDLFGAAVGSALDVNGDGVADVIAGAPAGRGYARVLSGKDGKVLRRLAGDRTGDAFGTSVGGLGDLDGDDLADVIVGAPESSGSGYARVISGKDGKVLATLRGAGAGNKFGSAVSGGLDVNRDGRPDVLAGALFGGYNNGGYALLLTGLAGPSTMSTFGAGCPAGRPLRLGYAGSALPGGTLSVKIEGGPRGVAAGAVLLGFDAGKPYPIDLAIISMPGCSQYHSADIVLPLSLSGGRANLRFVIPSQRALSGRTFFNQGAVLDRSANALGVSTSNAGKVVIAIQAPEPPVLPQAHAYQVVLRNFLASLTERDFTVPLSPLRYDPAWFKSNDDLYHFWIMSLDRGRQLPGSDLLRLPPSSFTLASIERFGRVNVPGAAIEPTAWWAQWSYPGNPHRGSRAVKLRAFVTAAVGMMMLDAAHERGSYRRSDYLGGSMIPFGYAYLAAKDAVPSIVRCAYETGLRKMFRRLETWGPTGIMGDMDEFAHVSMHYTAQAIGDPDLARRAVAHSKRILAYHLRPAGYIDHGGGFDATYEGISLYFLTWAALASGQPELQDAVKKISTLKAYLTLPEPGGKGFFGPSHFSTATSGDSANDQWAWFYRDLAAAMLSTDARYLVFGGRSRPSWTWFPAGVPTPAQMRAGIQNVIAYVNASLTTPLPPRNGTWREGHWSTGSNHAATHYQPGFYDAIAALKRGSSPLMLPPFSRKASFIKTFAKDFLVAKIGGFGAIVHTGRLSSWGKATGPLSGFGGGALSAFWTRATGSVILGRSGGFQGPHPDTWATWELWPTHAISGESATGQPFSTARVGFPASTYLAGSTTATVVATGFLGPRDRGGRSAPNGALAGDVAYKRTFKVDASGLSVESELTSDGKDRVRKLDEILPLFDNAAGPKISFRVAGKWTPASTTWVKSVTAVKVERLGGKIEITFATPRTVALSAKLWQDGYQTHVTVHNLLVDLLGSGGKAVPMPKRVVVRYRIAP